jgi:hypothetical protein
VLYCDQILDGRNRYRACVRANVALRFQSHDGDDPVAYVVGENVHRRHLTETQRAVTAAKLVTMGHGGDRKSVQDANLHFDQTEAAGLLGVCKRSKFGEKFAVCGSGGASPSWRSETRV